MDWISDILDPDSGCVQQDQEFGFPSCSHFRLDLDFVLTEKTLLVVYFTDIQPGVGFLESSWYRTGVVSDSKFAKQDWNRTQKNQRCAHLCCSPLGRGAQGAFVS